MEWGGAKVKGAGQVMTSERMCVHVCVFLQSSTMPHESIYKLCTFSSQATINVTPPFVLVRKTVNQLSFGS